MKRFTALAMAAVMTVGMAVCAGAATFSDIDDVPWEGAKEYINSVSDLGLMVGDNDSSGKKVFRANDRVTYCEAMQLAYSVLNETGGLKTTEDTVEKWTSTMEAANIPEWAYTAVSYGLESGVVSSNDITIFMKSATENREATRENVAVIFGKALSHLYDVDSDVVLTFSDADSISSTSVPYVDLLARLNIFVGDDSNNFNPKNYINRAEMAVIVSKSYNILTELAAEQEEEEPAVSTVTSNTGTVILVDNSSTEKTIALSDENAQVSTYTISSSTPVISLDGETKTYADVSVGDNLTVTTTNGIVVSIIINDDDEAEEEEETSNVLEGYLDNITNKAITFNNDDGDQLRYELASNVSISMNGGVITDDDLYEYVIDRNIIYITVTLNASGLVESIVAEFCDISGELMDFDDGDAYVKFVYGDKSRTVTVAVGSGCEIYLDGEKISETKAEKLFTSDDYEDETFYAVCTINNINKAEKIEIYRATYSSGTLVSISSSEITMESSFGMKLEYELDDDCEFTLNGSDSTYRAIKNALDDSDIIVTLEFDDDNIVTSVTAQSKTVKGILKGADDKRIIIVDDDGGRMSFGLDRNMECEFDGDEVTYSKFKSLYKDAESAVVAEVEIDDDGNVISVAAQSSSDSEGTVVSISSSSVVFEDIAGIEHEYKIEPAMVGYLNGEKLGSVAKVLEYARADGATIKVTFSSRGYVNRIYVTLDD